MWRERRRSYPGRPARNASKAGNRHRKVALNGQESAEVIVPAKGRQSREGLNMIVRVVHGKFEREA